MSDPKKPVRVTIYADTLEDAARAMQAVLQDAKAHPEGHGPRQRKRSRMGRS